MEGRKVEEKSERASERDAMQCNAIDACVPISITHDPSSKLPPPSANPQKTFHTEATVAMPMSSLSHHPRGRRVGRPQPWWAKSPRGTCVEIHQNEIPPSRSGTWKEEGTGELTLRLGFLWW